MVRKSRKTRKLQISVNDYISAAGPLVLPENCELKKERYPLNSRGNRPDLSVIYGGFCMPRKNEDEEVQIRYFKGEDGSQLLDEGLGASRAALIRCLTRALERNHVESMYRLGRVPDLEASSSNLEYEENDAEEEEEVPDAEGGSQNDLVSFEVQDSAPFKSDNLAASPKIVGKDEIGETLSLSGCQFN